VFVRLAWRFGNFKFLGVPVPVLLKRDIVFFGAIVAYIGSGLLALLVSASGLAHEWWWIVPRSFGFLASMAYWVWVEYHLEDGKEPQEGKEKK